MNIDQKQVEGFGNLELIARQAVEGFITGLHKSPFHGFSVEFSEHRLYNPGESVKHIDWKLYGRTDKLFVKRFEEETNLRCQIIIDGSSSMYYPADRGFTHDKPNKVLFSAYCAAALMYLFRMQRDAVGLSVFSDKIDVHTRARSSTTHHKMLYFELEKILHEYAENQRKRTSATQALHEIAESIHKRSLVVIFTDLMEQADGLRDFFSALQHLKHNKHEVILFHVLHRESETDFGFENRPYRFVDMETGSEVKLHPNEVREHYLRSVDAFKKELKLRCGQYRIDLVEADIAAGYYPVLFSYLVKRGKLY